jgi:hypothetical protein
MGVYINPRGMEKEEFLLRHGQRVNIDQAVIEENRLPVCLVDNGMFAAAGVGYNEGELEVFKKEDGRYKQWYMCRITDLLQVSDLGLYPKFAKMKV